MKCLITFCCIINLLNCVSNEELNYKKENTESDKDVFIPTNEWKIVKKGQVIPKGLHVRINLETGLKEAKLLEEDLKNENNALLEVDQPEGKQEAQNLDLKFARERLEEALKNIKNEDLSYIDDLKRVTKKFKNYEELKKELGNLNMSVKSDVEILHELFKRYKKYETDTNLEENTKKIQIINTLEEIEYLIHQIDNAQEFVKIKGFTDIIYKNFNSTDSRIKCQVLNILGSCTQNNPKVQIHALETGSVDKLLRILALENDNNVLSRALYATSSLLRRFPLAQAQFIKNGGLSVFYKIFEIPEKFKTQLRIVTLIYDLLLEHSLISEESKKSDYTVKKMQYDLVDLKSKLKENNWCNIFSKTLTNSVSTEKNNHDSIEVTLNVMHLLYDVCHYDSVEIKKLLIVINKKYEKLAQEEMKENSEESHIVNHNFYFLNLKELTDKLIKKMNHHSKTEL